MREFSFSIFKTGLRVAEKPLPRSGVSASSGVSFSPALPLGLALAAATLGLAGCSHGKPHAPDRQNLTLVRPSDQARLLPEEHSVHDQYRPGGPHSRPDSPVAYDPTPNMSYEDDTLDDNLAGSLELADYYDMVKRAGWGRWLMAGGPYTVLALPNAQMEALSRTWPGEGMTDPANHERLATFIGQSILVGKWSRPALKKALSTKKAQKAGGIVKTRTLTGQKVTLRLLPTGVIQLIGPEGTVSLRDKGYPQSNGIFYVTDRELSF